MSTIKQHAAEQARQGQTAREFFVNYSRVQPSPHALDLGAYSIPMLLSLLGGGFGDNDLTLGMLGALERDLDAADQIAHAAEHAGVNAQIKWGPILAPILVRCRVAHELLLRERCGADDAIETLTKSRDRAQKVALLAAELVAYIGCTAVEEDALRRIRAEVREQGLDEATSPLIEIAERELDRIGSVHSRAAKARELAACLETLEVGNEAKKTAEAAHWQTIDAKRAPAPVVPPVAPATRDAKKRKASSKASAKPKARARRAA